jgi:dTDP-4-dehydrorhamnose 3,5-epimerase
LRGNVRETYRQSWHPTMTVPPIRQLVRSESKAKVLRGMHLHRRQWDLWHFVSGDAVVRLRYADGQDVFDRLDAGSTLYIPPGVAHGFYTEEGCILLYALTEEYTGDDEFGFYPFDGLDADAHPAWPTSHLGIVVSERDLRAPRLSEFEW